MPYRTRNNIHPQVRSCWFSLRLLHLKGLETNGSIKQLRAQNARLTRESLALLQSAWIVVAIWQYESSLNIPGSETNPSNHCWDKSTVAWDNSRQWSERHATLMHFRWINCWKHLLPLRSMNLRSVPETTVRNSTMYQFYWFLCSHSSSKISKILFHLQRCRSCSPRPQCEGRVHKPGFRQLVWVTSGGARGQSWLPRSLGLCRNSTLSIEMSSHEVVQLSSTLINCHQLPSTVINCHQLCLCSVFGLRIALLCGTQQPLSQTNTHKVFSDNNCSPIALLRVLNPECRCMLLLLSYLFSR